MFTEAFASLQSSSGIQIAEAVLLLSTKLVMWEILRRNLKKNSHFFLQLSVIILMVLNTILTVATCLPTIHTGAEGSMMIEVGETSRLLFHFVASCYTVATLVQIGLGIGLFRKFAGMIRCYGASLFLWHDCHADKFRPHRAAAVHPAEKEHDDRGLTSGKPPDSTAHPTETETET